MQIFKKIYATLRFGPIFLYWWRPNEWKSGDLDNYGDWLSSYLIGKLTNRFIVRVSYPKRPLWLRFKHHISIGSILKCGGPMTTVWGSGLISRSEAVTVKSENIVALRGQYTHNELLGRGFTFNKHMPYGDPAVLMPLVYPDLVEKKHKIGLIVNHGEWEQFKHMAEWKSIKLIDLMTNSIEKTTNEILECDHIISSSLHGIILAQAYGRWTLGVKLTDKLSGDGIKFEDWFYCCNLNEPVDALIDLRSYQLHYCNEEFAETFFWNLIDKWTNEHSNSYESCHHLRAQELLTMQLDLLNSIPYSIFMKQIRKLKMLASEQCKINQYFENQSSGEISC